VQAAGFDEVVTYDELVWETPVHYARTRVRELFRLDWLAAQENVIFCGPVGVGKSWFAEALGYSACRAGHSVRFIKVAKLLLALRQARAELFRVRAADLADARPAHPRRLRPAQAHRPGVQ